MIAIATISQSNFDLMVDDTLLVSSGSTLVSDFPR